MSIIQDQMKDTGMFVTGIVMDHNEYGEERKNVDLLVAGMKHQVSVTLPDKVGFDFFPIGEKASVKVSYSEWKGRTYFKVLQILKQKA